MTKGAVSKPILIGEPRFDVLVSAHGVILHLDQAALYGSVDDVIARRAYGISR